MESKGFKTMQFTDILHFFLNMKVKNLQGHVLPLPKVLSVKNQSILELKASEW